MLIYNIPFITHHIHSSLAFIHQFILYIISHSISPNHHSLYTFNTLIHSHYITHHSLYISYTSHTLLNTSTVAYYHLFHSLSTVSFIIYSYHLHSLHHPQHTLTHHMTITDMNIDFFLTSFWRLSSSY